MTCEQAQKLLSAYLDRELDQQTEQALLDHLSQCPACALLKRSYKAIDNALLDQTQDVPEGFADRVMAALPRQAQPRRKHFAFGGFTALGAVAAVLILSVAAGWVKLPDWRSGRSVETEAAMVTADDVVVSEQTAPAAEAPMAPAPEPTPENSQQTDAGQAGDTDRTEAQSTANTLYAAQWRADTTAEEPAAPEESTAMVSEEASSPEMPAEAAEADSADIAVPKMTMAGGAAVTTEEAASPETPAEAAAEAAQEDAPADAEAAGGAPSALEDLPAAYTVTIPHSSDHALPEAVMNMDYIALPDGTRYCEMSRDALDALLRELDGLVDLIVEDPGNTGPARLVLEP